jgi:hypothetical protein
MHYAKPFLYSLAALPFYLVWKAQGLVVFNMALLLAMLWSAWWFFHRAGEGGEHRLGLGPEDGRLEGSGGWSRGRSPAADPTEPVPLPLPASPQRPQPLSLPDPERVVRWSRRRGAGPSQASTSDRARQVRGRREGPS